MGALHFCQLLLRIPGGQASQILLQGSGHGNTQQRFGNWQRPTHRHYREGEPEPRHPWEEALKVG